MSGKKNKKLRKMQKNQAKVMAHQATDTEDHSVPADVAARLMSHLPRDLQDGTAPLQFDPALQITPMSAVILDVIDPWLDVADEVGMDDRKNTSYLNLLCTLASFAWSLKLIDDKAGRDNAIEDIVEFISKHISNDEAGLGMCTDIVMGMLERAEDLYPEDERAVTSFEIVEEKNGPKLYVASALPPASVPESVRAGLASGRLKQIAPVSAPPAEHPTAPVVEIDPAAHSELHNEKAR
jgi:hypothetical protein